MKTPFCLLLTVLLFALCGCGKDPLNELPPATQTGANTFGCKVNGVTYKCSGHWDFKNFLTLEGVCGNYANGEFAIYALTKNPHNNIAIKFNCKENTPGIYRENIRYHTSHTEENSDSYIEITRFDKSVIAGRFQMKIKSIVQEYDSEGVFISTHEEVDTITEGRFDIKRDN